MKPKSSCIFEGARITQRENYKISNTQGKNKFINNDNIIVDQINKIFLGLRCVNGETEKMDGRTKVDTGQIDPPNNIYYLV